MNVRVNGDDRQVEDGATVAGLLSACGFPLRLVVVERNGRVVYPENWEATPVEAGDVFEIASFVGGG